VHNFCSSDLSAFYFDIRKDALYCDRPDTLRRRAARTVLDHLHRCLCTWLAPVLVFTAEEAWTARFGEADSVHLHDFPAIPAAWRDDALGAKWEAVRELRRLGTTELEAMRADKRIGASTQAVVTMALPDEQAGLLSAEAWADILIVAGTTVERAAVAGARAAVAPGAKCERCWKVLPEVGRHEAHPGLCARCVDAVESGLVCR
jgi:isoleucyl-tRNA synthetase